MARKKFSMTVLSIMAITGLGLMTTPGAFASETTTYTYDVHGRLVEVNVTDTS